MKKVKNIAKKNARSFSLFFLTAVFGASVNFLTQIPYQKWLLNYDFQYESALSWSIVASYLTATIVSFIPAKLFAFQARRTGNTKRETIKFLLISLAALWIQESISIFTFKNIANTFFSEYGEVIRIKGSHLVGMGFSFMANYLGHRLITFRSTGFYKIFKDIRS